MSSITDIAFFFHSAAAHKNQEPGESTKAKKSQGSKILNTPQAIASPPKC